VSRLSLRALLALSGCSLAVLSTASHAQDRPAQAASTSETTLEEISVTSETVAAKPQTAPAASAGYVGGVTGIGGSLLSVDSASAGILTGAQVNNRPVTRPGEVLEAVPGLIVTQHSGEGKANQFFLRGFNLDHGTDIALFLDGMPLNMRMDRATPTSIS